MLPRASEENREILDSITHAFREQDRVAAAWLFGSRTKGKAHANSDIDIGVLLEPAPRREELHEVVRGLLQALAGYLATEKVQLAILNDAPPALALRVLAEGRTALCRDPVVAHRFRVRTYDLHADFAPAEALFLRATRERALRMAGRG